MWTDYLTVGAEHTAETTYKATGSTGSEIVGLFIRDDAGTIGTELTQVTTAPSSATEFEYDPEDKELTFHSTVGSADAPVEIVVYYKRKITANVLVNDSGKYSGKAALYIDAIGEDKCAHVFRVQFYIPKADFSGDFTFDMGDNQAVHSFEADALSGACGTAGMFFTYTIFGATTEDYSGT